MRFTRLDRHTRELATEALRQAFGPDTRITNARSLGGARQRSVVHRLTLEGSSAPRTVVSKRLRTTRRIGDDDPLELFAAELAALWYLSGLEGDPLAPALYADNPVEHLLVMEDLGSGPSLSDALLGDDADRAVAAMHAYTGALGRLGGASLAQHDQLRGYRRELGAGDDDDLWAREVAGLREQIPEAMRLLGIVPTTASNTALDDLAEQVTGPESWPTLSHGDPCPDNNVLEGTDRCRFLDFEFARVRPALVDGAYPILAFPTCWCAARPPAGLEEQLEVTYRTAFAEHVPEAGDDRRFGRALTAAAAMWVLSELSRRVPVVLDEDREWGLGSWRRRALHEMRTFAALARRHGQLVEVAELVEVARARLEDRWGSTEGLPGYPAFGSCRAE